MFNLLIGQGSLTSFSGGGDLMNTPFEDLEYLADFIPEEGETMIVSRRDGELVCEPFAQETGREGITDPEFYGRLVQASERLSLQGTMPLWVCLVTCFWCCVAFHLITGIGWAGAFLDIGMAMMALMIGYCWIRARHQRMFQTEIRPMLELGKSAVGDCRNTPSSAPFVSTRKCGR